MGKALDMRVTLIGQMKRPHIIGFRPVLFHNEHSARVLE